MTDANQEPALGTVIDGCRLVKVIGRGGMGVVYLAEQEALRRKVAVKVIAPAFAGDAGFRARFERESRLAASLDHPNIVPVFSAGEADGRLYIVMRYVKGVDLREVLAREGALKPENAARIVTDVAAALDAAHGAGLVHRDVKPANILLTRSPDGDRAYLSDFGLTKRASSESAVTMTGQWVGTLDYIAPEQFERGKVDARTDIYALGCVLFEMLTARVPYAGTDVQKMWAHVNSPPPSLAELLPGIAPAFDPVIQRAVAKDPAERFPSAGDLARAAAAAVGDTAPTHQQETVASGRPPPGAPDASATVASRPEGEAHPGSTGEPPPAPAHPAQGRPRSRAPLVIAAVVLLLAGAAAAVLLTTGGDDSSPTKQAATAGATETTGSTPAPSPVAEPGKDIAGTEGPDELTGTAGDDVFLDSEDDAVDMISCGDGEDLVSKPDARDILSADCEEVAWTARPIAPGRPYENRIFASPEVSGDSVTFEATCRQACEGVVELHSPTSRELLGTGTFELPAGREGTIRANLNSQGQSYVGTGVNTRVVLRASHGQPTERVNSGFTAPLGG